MTVWQSSTFISEAEGARTLNLRIDSPMPENPKSLPNTPLTENLKNDLASCLALLNAEQPDLAAVVRAWPGLSADVKAKIKRLIERA